MKLSDRIKKLREKNKYVNGGFAFARALGRSKIGRNASSISFYIFISIIPLFILLCAQLPYTGISEAELQSAIVEITPDAVHELVVAVVKEAYTARRAIFSVSVVFLLWSSSKAMLAVIQSLDMVYCRKEKRSYFVMVAFSLLYTVTLLMLAGGALVLYSRGHNLEEMIAVSFPTKAMFQAWAKRGHNLIALLVITLFYSLIYRFAPSGKRKWRYQLPGAIFAAVGTSLFSVYFAIYNNRGNIYNSFYGSLAATAVFLVWIYFCVSIMLIGGVINHHFSLKIAHFLRLKKKKEKTKNN